MTLFQANNLETTTSLKMLLIRSPLSFCPTGSGIGAFSFLYHD